MVEGIEIFKKRFENYIDCYTVIGGAACEILMTDIALAFRETRDIDIILIVEEKFPDFARLFWQFIKEGGYKCGWKNNDKMHFYRFTQPKAGYPIQIELFSRNLEQRFETDIGIIPIHIEDDISSLSAILLDENYYDLMMEGRIVVNGIPVLDSAYLIVFKMYAFMNLESEKKKGKFVKERDYKKHKYDVFRLLQIIDRNKRIFLVPEIKKMVNSFCDFMSQEEIPYNNLGILAGDKENDLALIKQIFSI